MGFDIVAAAEVFWGTYVPMEEVDLPNTMTPEQELISKEKFSTLSEEARRAVEIILDMPDDMFHKNGKAAKMKTVREIRKGLRCSKCRAHQLLGEIHNRLKGG
jgi:hypothetical protein